MGKRKPILWTILGLAGSAFLADRLFRGSTFKGHSDNLEGGEFKNTGGGKNSISRTVGKIMLNFDKWELWPKAYEKPLAKIQPSYFDEENQVKVYFIGHATCLIQWNGLNILTDPMFSRSAGPLGKMGPARKAPPGVNIQGLPPIDMVLLSHNHYDHFDMDSLEYIGASQHKSPIVITGLGNAKLIKRTGLHPAVELDWGESITYKGWQVYFEECKHSSGRAFSDQNKSLWGSFVIENPKGQKVYFGGDSAYGGHYRRIHRKHGPMDLSFLPIGAYRPKEAFGDIHMNPEEAINAHKDLHSKETIAIHHGTFQLTLEGRFDPIKELMEAMEKESEPISPFYSLKNGASKLIDLEKKDV